MIKTNCILLFFLLQISNCFCQLYIQGKVSGELASPVLIFTPINSFFNLNNEVSIIKINLNEANEFKTNIPPNFNSGFITMRIGDRNLYLAFENSDSIYLNINLINKENWFSIRGSNATGHMLLNKYLAEPILSFNSIYDYFDNNKIKSLNPIKFFKKNLSTQSFFIDSLYNRKEISENFHFLAKQAIYVSQSDEFLKPFLRPSKLHSFYQIQTINSFIDSIFSIVNPTDSMILKAFASRNYVSSFYENIEKKIKGYHDIFEIKDTTLKYPDGQILKVSDSYTPFLNIGNLAVKEFLWGSLYHDIENMFPEASRETDIIAFEKYFPNSIFGSQMQRSRMKLNKNSINKQNPEIIIDTLNNFKTLHEVYDKYFNGNSVYIDLWATWCIPCKNEFNFISTIDSFFSVKKVKRLYISLDEKESFNTWVNNVYSFSLKGVNIMAQTQLKKSILKEIFNNKTLYSIPRYVFMNGKGEIILKNAYRPSDKENLYKQITQLIK